MKYFLVLVLLIACAVPLPAQVQPASAEEKLRVAGEVYRIFEAKCADCHGAHLAKPKGKFGHVLDLAKVGANKDYVEVGSIAKSEIYQMVLHNEMPGEDADVPPLTKDELAVVERWINIGAPGAPVPEAGAQAAAPAPSAAGGVPFFRKVLTWVGKFHPASTHFPVALLLTAVLAEGFAWWLRKPEWTLLVRFLVVLGALSSIPTAVLGWLASFPTVQGSTTEFVYNIHRILGTTTAVWGVVCAVLICMAECEEGSFERKRFRGALLLGALLVAATGMLGGMLTFGVEHYKF